MSKYQHRTNLTNNTAPLGSELEAGEIGINGTSLGLASDGFNNGRLYIKLSSGEVRRFIGLGLPGTSDPSLKTKYGGTNNDFGTVTAPVQTNNKPLLYFNYNVNGNHTLDKTTNDTLTWDTSNSRLKIGGVETSAAAATLDVRGDVRIDTVSNSSSTFASTSRILGWDTSSKTLSAIDAPNFFTYFPSNSVPVSKISGILPLANGGTNVNFTAIGGLVDGNVVFYDANNTRFSASNRFRWDSTGNILHINGGVSATGVISTTSYFENNVPSEASTNAVPIGVDGSNKIVRLSSSNSNNLSFTTIQVSGAGSVVADSNNDTVILVAGNGIALNADTANDTITITNTGGGGGSSVGVNVNNAVSSTVTLTNSSDKYQFLTPSGNNYNVILSLTSMVEGQEFIVNNLDVSTYTLSVYNSGTGGTLLATLGGFSMPAPPSGGLFVFDGTQWRTALLS